MVDKNVEGSEPVEPVKDLGPHGDGRYVGWSNYEIDLFEARWAEKYEENQRLGFGG